MDFQNKTQLFLLLLGLSITVGRIPFLGKIVKVFYTMVHELGHAMMTVITRGEIISMNFFTDTSGNTITKSKGKFGQFLIAISGYPFASAMAFITLYLIHINKINIVIFIYACMALTELIFWIRNLYGILWLVGFLLLLLFVYRMENGVYNYVVTLFLSTILLSESIVSGFLQLVHSKKHPSGTGDAGNLKMITNIAASFWALLFLVFASVLAYFCIIIFIN
jgi:hypothetical protein